MVAEYIHKCELILFDSIMLFRKVHIVIFNSTVICVSLLGIQLTVEIQTSMNPKATLKEFKEKLAQDENYQKRMKEIREEVEAFAEKFPMPGLPEL